MGNEQIQVILARLDNLEKQNEQITEIITSIADRLDCMQEVAIKNGGGRIVTYKRGEFFQMLYDRNKETFSRVSDVSKKLLNITDVVFKFAVAAYVVIKAVKGGLF